MGVHGCAVWVGYKESKSAFAPPLTSLEEGRTSSLLKRQAQICTAFGRSGDRISSVQPPKWRLLLQYLIGMMISSPQIIAYHCP